MSPSQRLLPDNTQHSQRQASLNETGFQPELPARFRPQTPALRRSATGTGSFENLKIGFYYITLLIYFVKMC